MFDEEINEFLKSIEIRHPLDKFASTKEKILNEVNSCKCIELI